METKKTERWFELDLIRVLAMLLVFVFHFNVRLQELGFSGKVLMTAAGKNSSLGQLGVVLFFLLSGMTSVLSYERQRKENPLKRAGRYYEKRWLAIMPEFYLAYLLLTHTLCANRLPLDEKMLWTLLGIDGYLDKAWIPTHYLIGEWFLGALLVMYLLFPLLYHFIRKHPVAAGLVLLTYEICLVQWCPFSHLPKDCLVSVRIFDFCLGIYLGIFLGRIRLLRTWELAAALGVFLLTTFVPLAMDRIYLVSLQGLSLFILLMALGRAADKAQRPVSTRFRGIISLLASCSYGAFLLHHVLMFRFIEGTMPMPVGIRWWTLNFAWLLGIIFLAGFMLHAGTGAVLALFHRRGES